MTYQHRLQLKIESRVDQVALIAISLKGICRYLDYPEKSIMEVELCLCEMVNNVIEHGYHSVPGKPILVTFEFEMDRLVIKIMDEAESIPTLSPAEIHVKGDNYEDLSERGYGRYLVRKLMDDLQYETISGHNIMTLVKNMSRKDCSSESAADSPA